APAPDHGSAHRPPDRRRDRAPADPCRATQAGLFSPPPCGEGLGWGQCGFARASATYVFLAPLSLPSPKGGRDQIRERTIYPRFSSLKKSLPLLSMTMKAGKSTTSMRQIASMPSSGYSTHSTFLMQCSARFAAAPPIEAR